MLTRDEVFRRLRFYAVYDSRCEIAPTRWLDAVLAAGFRTVQVRDKSRLIDVRVLTLMVRRCRRNDVFFLLNDHVDLACEIEADGVHLGEEDRPVAEVRAIFRNWLVGRSARCRQDAVRAWRDGADYIGTGPIYATASKEGLPAAIGWKGLTEVADSTPLPVVAIGGLQVDRLEADPAFRRANGLAFLSALDSYEGISTVATWIRDQS